MYLAHHWNDKGIFLFDPTQGTVRPSNVSSEQADWGALWQQNSEWFAIWKDTESLIFQTGPKQWRLNKQITLAVRPGFRRTFEIQRAGQSEFIFKYGFKGALAQAFGATYDSIDEEHDDFFVYVTSMWDYWKNEPIAQFLKT